MADGRWPGADHPHRKPIGACVTRLARPTAPHSSALPWASPGSTGQGVPEEVALVYPRRPQHGSAAAPGQTGQTPTNWAIAPIVRFLRLPSWSTYTGSPFVPSYERDTSEIDPTGLLAGLPATAGATKSLCPSPATEEASETAVFPGNGHTWYLSPMVPTAGIPLGTGWHAGASSAANSGTTHASLCV